MNNTDKFIINGGKPLQGEIEVRGAKNATFPILAATLLTKQECVIGNLPLIEDVFRMLEIMESIGVDVDWVGERTVKIRAKNIDLSKIREDLMKKFRGSVLLYGPLLARFKKIKVPQPGGCLIGVRPITTHLDAFSQMGAETTEGIKEFQISLASNKKSQDKTIVLPEFSVTGTENMMLFASSLPQKTTIKIADEDYQIQDLAKFLKKMGVKIQGAGTHTIILQGAKNLKGVQHDILYDPIEAGTFILLAAATKGDVLIKNVELNFLELPLKKLSDFGVNLEILKTSSKRGSVRVKPWKSLKIDKIQSLPYPGIPSDLQSVFGVLATQAKGPTLIHDPMYDGRLKYLEEINKMGGEIIFADPHRAIVNGPTQLFGTELGPYDLRGGAALIIAALIAKGTSAINNIYQVDRGYEHIEERLQKIGADIKRIHA